MKNNNFKKIVWVFLAVGLMVFALFGQREPVETVNEIPAPVVMGNALDLVSLSFNPGDTLSGQNTISGTIKNAYFFEANIIVKVTDLSNNILLNTYGTATTDWMTAGPVSFSTNVDFTGLPVGPAYLILENDNPSGDPALVKQIIIPIVIN